MKKQLALFAAANLLAAAPFLAAQSTGTSNPEALNDTITATQPVKVVRQTPIPTPQLHTRTPDLNAETATPAPIVVRPTSTVTTTYASPSANVADNEDAGIVIDVPSAANALPEGTQVRVKLGAEISTRETRSNTHFTATTVQAVMKGNRVVIPIGTILTGRITELASGHHLRRPAAIHLQPDFLILPNGQRYKLNAQVIDLNATNYTYVSREGTILGNDPTPGTATAVGVSTGAGAITGAVIGGGVGAVVGAGVGAGVSGAVWANQKTSHTLRAGTQIVFALSQPMLLENVAIAN
ncbi:MAG: hypothetical protein ABI142_05215 [Bryocella sp.]